MELATDIRAVLLDIEGTTTPSTFVYEVLFPYAGRSLNQFIRNYSRDREVRSHLVELRENHIADVSANLGPPAWDGDSEEALITSSVAYAEWLIIRDSKHSALKWLQGKIWEKGYSDGELLGQVYSDVPQALRRWREREKRIYIYSSGSVLAQRLLFQTTQYGDLTSQLDGFFDAKVGTKTDPASYRELLLQISCGPREVLFISDTIEELEAAQAVGIGVVWSIRSENDMPSSTGFPVVRSFDEIVTA